MMLYHRSSKDQIPLFQTVKKSVRIRNAVLPLFLTLTFFLAPQRYLSAQVGYKSAKEWEAILTQPHPLPSYNIDSLRIRLSTYSFLKGSKTVNLFTEVLPILGSTVAELLEKNDSTLLPGSKLSFLRDDGIFLITTLRVEESLQKLEALIDSLVMEKHTFHTHDSATANQLLNNLRATMASLAHTKDPRDLSTLQIKKKSLELEAKNYIDKRTTYLLNLLKGMEKACKGSRDLLVIMQDLEKRLKYISGFHYLSDTDKHIIESDRLITQNIYERAYLLYKKSFLRAVQILRH